jgi:DNA-binding response OmpR family regulator
MTQVLLVDDDRDLVDLVSFSLRRAGLEPIAAYDAEGALRTLRHNTPDMVVLDLNIGADDGFHVLEELRRFTTTPVIVLSARILEDDKVRCFELGADDYVTKPFGHRELIARIQTVLKRHAPLAPATPEAPLACGSVVLNRAMRTVTVRGEPVDLTVTEFRLLHFLLLNAEAVVPLNVLLRQVWGHQETDSEDVVRVTMHRLRRKIEVDPAHPDLLRTVPRVGFILTGGQ